MELKLLIKVLISLRENPNLLIPAKLLTPLSGFAKLRREGYINISKVGQRYKANLTLKAYKTIDEHLLNDN